MSTTKLIEEDLEKPPLDSPIVFRPITQPSAFGTPSVGFRNFFRGEIDNGANVRRRGRLLLCCSAFILASLILAGTLIIMVMVGLGPYSLLYRQILGKNILYTSSRCHIELPPDAFSEGVSGDLTENIYPPMSQTHSNILNISLNALPPFSKVNILHLFADNLTVIRTPDMCYIRPMREDMFKAYKGNKLNELRAGIKTDGYQKAEVTTEPLYITEAKDPGIIRNSLVAHWCSGVPALRLVTQPPPNIAVGDWWPRTPAPSSAHDLSIHVDSNRLRPPADLNRGRFADDVDGIESDDDDDDDDEDDDEDDDDDDDKVESFLSDRPSNLGVRQKRSISLADAMHLDPARLPRVNLKPGPVTGCRVVGQILEDFSVPPIASQSSSSVKVTRDVIFRC